jgi:hypothetical protein
LCSEVWNLSAVRTACRKIGTYNFDGFQCTLIAFIGSFRFVVKGSAPVGRSSRIVSERDGQDVSDRIEDRELFLAEEVDRAMRRGQQD